MTAIGAYRAMTRICGPLIRLYLNGRLAVGKEDRNRFAERLGVAGLARPAGRLVWMHGASVGEALSLLPLVQRMRRIRPDLATLMTTGTVTSARVMADRLPAGAFHQFVPVDRLPYVRRFLDHWRPDLVIWAESEFWPNMITETARRGVPKVLVQGRVSPRSFARWSRHPATIRSLLDGFALCLGQTESDTARLRALGASRARYLGNLKFAAPPLPADPVAQVELEGAMSGRMRWLAASTHAGEEEVAAQVHRRLRAKRSGVLTIIAPRHPERGAAVARKLAHTGLVVARRSAGEAIAADTDVYLADTIGELGVFYRLAPVVFIGKSLIGEGGQNPLEAAQLGCAIVHGPHMENFAQMAISLGEAGASIQVADPAELGEVVDRLLGDDAERGRRGAAARAVVASQAGVLDAVVEAIAPYLSGPSRDEPRDRPVGGTRDGERASA